MKNPTGKKVLFIGKIPATMTCQICGARMKLVSIDIGYSCTNEACALHVEPALC